MMKKVSLSQLLSRSPRHGTPQDRRASSANGDMFVGGAASHTASPTHTPSTQEKTPKKKSKSSLLQTLKKKISGKLSDTLNNSTSIPKKSKSFEGLSNSFGDSFSQSVSEESSSDGLNASGGLSHKSKHSKRAIRPMHTPVTRQNSASHVLADPDGEGKGGEALRIGMGRGGVEVGGLTPQVATVSLYSAAQSSSHISETLSPVLPEALSDHQGGGEVPQVVVEGVATSYAEPNSAPELSAISETSSPQPNRTCSEPWASGAGREGDLEASKRSLAEELFRLARYGWYWGPISRAEAEEKLLEQPDGAFLVRDSSDDKYLLSLSFRSFNKTLHTRIEHSNGWFSFYPHPEHEGHRSLVGLIDHCMSHSESGVFCYSRAKVPGSPSFPVRLTKPVSRFTQVRSLQYLCRFVIRQYTRVDHIQALPLPSRIKGYLEEGHY